MKEQIESLIYVKQERLKDTQRQKAQADKEGNTSLWLMHSTQETELKVTINQLENILEGNE